MHDIYVYVSKEFVKQSVKQTQHFNFIKMIKKNFSKKQCYIFFKAPATLKLQKF